MKILFIARHFTYFRNFDSVIALLAERGHTLHLAADGEEALGGRELVERLAAAYPGRVTIGFTPSQAGSERSLITSLRLGLDYLRYTDPVYESTPAIRARAVERTPAFALALGRLPVRRPAVRVLEALEESAAASVSSEVEAFIAGHQPDLVLITPLIGLGSPQLDYLRAARRAGRRNALCVWSWDHLSSKSLIRVTPDRLIVWNETQRSEAGRFHDVDPARVIVTGAQCFDRWFDRLPSRDRDAFCQRVGLPADRPFFLWVCSALFRGSPSEAAFVRHWIAALRSAPDPRVREAAVLIRPHPQRAKEWVGADWVRGLPNVSMWGENPMDETSRADYFDSMYHSAAVVGLNTSALVEAAILDRPVYTILAPEFRDNQEGTFHFHYLLTIGNGFLQSTRSLDDHARQIAGAFAGAPAANREFVRAFIRPHDRPATQVFADTVERLAAEPAPAPAPAPGWLGLLQPVTRLMANTADAPGIQRAYWSPTRRAEVLARDEMIGAHRRRRQTNERARQVRIARKAVRTAFWRTGAAIKGAGRRLDRQRQHLVVRTKTVARQALTACGLLKSS
jgi:hypothetical protein